jgi:hypothetical protein
MANPVIETRPFTNGHLTIRSSKEFAETKTTLERLVPRIDDGIFTLLRYGEARRALAELEASPRLLIFGFRDHGALLAIAGQKRRSIQCDIGNPLTASKMTCGRRRFVMPDHQHPIVLINTFRLKTEDQENCSHC